MIEAGDFFTGLLAGLVIGAGIGILVSGYAYAVRWREWAELMRRGKR